MKENSEVDIDTAELGDQKKNVSGSTVIRACARKSFDGPEEHKSIMDSSPIVPKKTSVNKVNISVKFVGRYVPPPRPRASRRRGTLQH